MSHKRDVHEEKPNGVIKGTVPTIPLHLESETCPICNESYKTNTNLRNHLKYKHGYYIYHCQWCTEYKYFPKDIAEHVLERHPGKETAHCPVCKDPIFFGSKVQDFVDHQNECTKKVKRKYAMDQRKRMRLIPPQPKVACHICGKMLTNQNTLKAHVARHNRSDASFCPFECEFEGCTKRFPRQSEMKLHARIHTGSQKVTCDQCGKTFNDIVKLREHVDIVHDKKFDRYKCKICPEAFPRSADLLHHKELVHSPKNFTCCDETFTTSKAFKSHKQKYHRVIKKKWYPCEICGNELKDKGKLRKHLKLHSDPSAIPFRCDLCDYKGLATNTNVVSALLANHKKKCHKEEYEFGQRVFVQGKMRIPTPLNILSP